ncbi:FAD-dependent monooxygenase [Lentzea sp.]|uniref:FAD-dependent monooxygenase n=1 Tax=Lentzea sp. TaxID=56099 RepID=UPI002ED40014
MFSTNEKPSARRVLVSGASIAGLTTAYWLTRHGFEVTVVEVAPRLRPGGHAIDVRGPALAVAERMGLDAVLRERGTNLTGIAVVDPAGREVFRSTEGTLTGGQLDSSDIEIMRDDLCEVLYGAVRDEAEFLFGDTITSLTQDDTGVDVTFATAAPRRFDVVVGADGVGSGVRRLAFGPDERFLHVMGENLVAVFSMPNFLGLERWQILCQQEEPAIGALVMGLRKDVPARAYVGFDTEDRVEYDPRNVAGQKRVVAERLAAGGWVIPEIVRHMMDAPDFHLYRLTQVRVDRWSRGRVVLAGDAGYAVSLGTGQATSVAMVGAYVLAGELAAHRDDPAAGAAAYEDELREYVTRNQDVAVEQESMRRSVLVGEDDAGGGLPDFGTLTLPFSLKDYGQRVPTA